MRKRLIDNEPSWLFDCHSMSTLKQQLRLQIDWRQKRAHFSVWIISLGHSAYITFHIFMSFRNPCHMPFHKLIPPFTLTAPNVNSFYILTLSSVAINLYRCWATQVKTLYIAAVIILKKVTDSLLHSRFLCRHATFLPWGGALRDDTKCSRLSDWWKRPVIYCVNRKQETVVHFYVLSRLWVIDVFEIS